MNQHCDVMDRAGKGKMRKMRGQKDCTRTEDRRLADGGHEEDWSDRGGERIRVRTDTTREREKTKKARRCEKEESTTEEERRSKRRTAGAVGYLLVIQPLTMPL